MPKTSLQMLLRISPIALLTLVVSFCVLRVPRAQADDTTDLSAQRTVYEEGVQATLKQYCVTCHGSKTQKAHLRLDTLQPTFIGAAGETWHDVLRRMDQGEMPPPKAPQPSDSQRRQMTSWIRTNLQLAAQQRQGDDGQVVLRRLTRYEYNNTMRDLLGMKLDYAKDLPPESASEDGFQNNGATLAISPLQLEYYLKAARTAMDKAIVTGPAPEVHRHHFEQSTTSNRRRNTVVGNRMPPGGVFYGKMLEFPREGEFVIRIKAGADIPAGMGSPRMRVSIGIRSDTQSPAKSVAEVDVANPEEAKEVYEFRGRIEEFPLPGHNPKFPGVTVTVSNVYDDGLPPLRPFTYKPIKLSKQQRQQVAMLFRDNAPLTLPKTNPRPDAKSLRPFRVHIEKLQRQVEELRMIPTDHPNKLDIAYRLHDVRTFREGIQKLVEDLAKHFAMEPAELWSKYQQANADSLEAVETIFSRFPGIQPIDRKDKKAATALMPKQPPRSTLVIESLDFVGPVFDSWPPRTHTRLLPNRAGDERSRAKSAIASFAARAFRRPVLDSEVKTLLAFYDKIRPTSESFEEAMRECFSLVLISPEFLYLIEPDNNDAGRPLTPYELASRISYFLWSTMPDQRLIDLAKANELTNEEVLEELVRDMLSEARSNELITHFTNQWLDLGGIDRVAVNPEYYPDFDDGLKPLMQRETQLFFAELLRKDLSALNLIESDFAIINEPLAKHYGLKAPATEEPAVRGHAFQRVALEPSDRRGGLLTQASVLMLNSTGEDSHPIRRAVWILDRLLNDPPAPPPPDVPELNSTAPDFAKLPLKTQLELHRKREACNDCHRGIDPWGIPLEHYDAVGKWRDEVLRISDGKRKSRAPVDDRAELPNGDQVDGIDSLKQHLLRHQRERFAKALTAKLLSYSLGRSLTLDDEPIVEQLAARFERQDHRLAELIVAIVQSETFRTK